MTERRCDRCGMLYPVKELLVNRKRNVAMCQHCSGLLDGEDLSCRYVEG